MFPEEFLQSKKARDANDTSKATASDCHLPSRHLGGIGMKMFEQVLIVVRYCALYIL